MAEVTGRSSDAAYAVRLRWERFKLAISEAWLRLRGVKGDMPEIEHVIRVAETGEEIVVSREQFVDAVAGRLMSEHGETLRKLGEDD